MNTHETLEDNEFVVIRYSFLQRWVDESNLLYVELIEHKTCSDLLPYSLQDYSIFLCWNVLFKVLFTRSKNLNCIFQGNLYIKSLIIEIVVYLQQLLRATWLVTLTL